MARVRHLDGHFRRARRSIGRARPTVVGRVRRGISQAQAKLAALRHRIHAVVDEIQKDLLEVSRVAVNLRAVARQVHLHLDLPLLQSRGGNQNRLLERAAEVHGFNFQVKLARPGEQLLHGPYNILDLVFDNLNAALRNVIQGFAAREQLHVAGNGIERCADLVGEAGGKLPGHRQALRARQVLLRLEELLVDALEFFVAQRELASGFLHLAGQLRAEILDAGQHEVQVLGEFADLIPAGHTRAQVELASFGSLHDADHLSHWFANAAEEENVDHQRDQAQTGQRHKEVPQHQIPGDGVQAGLRDLEVQAADARTPLADRRRDDPVVAVGRFNRDLVVIGPLELVVVFDAAKLVEFQVLTAWIGSRNQVRPGAV